MRILYVCADRGISAGGSKGASAHLRGISAALLLRGHGVLMACRRTDGESPPHPQIEVRLLPDDEAGHAEWLTDEIRRWRADVVLERYSLGSGPAAAACRATGLRLVLEVNAPLVDEAARHRGLVDVEMWRARERNVLNEAEALVAVSPAVAGHVIGAGVPAGRVVVIPNGVDVERFRGASGAQVRARLGLGDAPVVGFCGSLKPWHGVDDLLAAVATLPEHVRVLIIGDGPERAALERSAAQVGPAGRVVFAGAVVETAVPEHLAALDIAVAPYAPMPGFYFSPLKVIEYLAAGLPVVASAQGEMLELDGALITAPAGDVAALAGAIAGLIGDPEARAALGRRATALAAKRSWGGVAGRLEPLLAPAGVRA